jgi:hypothetical protein
MILSIKMTELNLFRSYFQIITAIDYCIAETLITPALVLIYSTIDSVSWIASDDEDQSVGERFQSWVNVWMLQKYPLPCTALELYAARCGILHTLTPDSDLTSKKGVRRISYACGKEQYKDLDESIKLTKYPGIVAVHVNDIVASFKNGFVDYIDALDTDKVKIELFIEKAGKHFANVDISVISDFLASTQNDGG